MVKRSMFVGMDVHKESIDISVAEEGRQSEVRYYGAIPGDLEALAKVVRALRAPTRRLRFVYEAGSCGFGIHRYLTAHGEDCVVVNPSSMPKRSGDRIKHGLTLAVRPTPREVAPTSGKNTCKTQGTKGPMVGCPGSLPARRNARLPTCTRAPSA